MILNSCNGNKKKIVHKTCLKEELKFTAKTIQSYLKSDATNIFKL